MEAKIAILFCVLIACIWAMTQRVRDKKRNKRLMIKRRVSNTPLIDTAEPWLQEIYIKLNEDFEHQWDAGNESVYMCETCGKLVEERWKSYASRKAHVCD
jgi:hypothetical protein